MTFAWTNTGTQMLRLPVGALECQAWGPSPSEAPTIVLLHEGLGSTALWRDFPEQLSQATGAGVFAYSRLGYGQSDAARLPRPVDYMTREAVEVLPQVLDAVGFQRGMLLGHSDGATIAAIYSGSVSDQRVRGLALIAPHFFTEPSGLAEIARAKQTFETSDMKDRMARYHRDPEATFRGWNDVWLNPDFAAWNVGDSIDHWRIPVLGIQGAEDEYGTLAQLEEIEGRIYAPFEKVVLENCRHAPHLDQPQATLAAVREFYARLERLEQEVVAFA